MSDTAVYTLAGVVVTGILGLLSAVVVQWLKSKSDEHTKAEEVLAAARSATHTELLAVIEVLRKQLADEQAAAQRADTESVDFERRWRAAKDLALQWEFECEKWRRVAEDRQRERDDAYAGAERMNLAHSRIAAELAEMRRIARQHAEQNDRLFTSWTAERLGDQYDLARMRVVATTLRDGLIALRDEVLRLGGDPGPAPAPLVLPPLRALPARQIPPAGEE